LFLLINSYFLKLRGNFSIPSKYLPRSQGISCPAFAKLINHRTMIIDM